MKQKTKKSSKKLSSLEKLLFAKAPKIKDSKLSKNFVHQSLDSIVGSSKKIIDGFDESKEINKLFSAGLSSISDFDELGDISFSSPLAADDKIEELNNIKKKVDSLLSGDLDSWLFNVVDTLKKDSKDYEIRVKSNRLITKKLAQCPDYKSDIMLTELSEPVSNLFEIIKKFNSNQDLEKQISKAKKKNSKKILQEIKILENQLSLNNLTGQNKIHCQLALVIAYIKLEKYQEAINILDFFYEQIQSIISDIKNYKEKTSVELIDYYKFLIQSYAYGIQCNLALSKNQEAIELCRALLKNMNIKKILLEKNKILISKEDILVEAFFKQKIEILNNQQNSLKYLSENKDKYLIEKTSPKKNKKKNNSKNIEEKEIKIEIKSQPDDSLSSIPKIKEMEKEKVKELPSIQPPSLINLITKPTLSIKSEDLVIDVKNVLGLNKEFCQTLSSEIQEKNDQKIFLELKEIKSQDFNAEFETIKLVMVDNPKKSADLFAIYLSKLQASILFIKQQHNYLKYVTLFDFYIKVTAYYMRCLLILAQTEKANNLKKSVITELNKHKKLLWKNNITLHTQNYGAVKKLFNQIIELHIDVEKKNVPPSVQEGFAKPMAKSPESLLSIVEEKKISIVLPRFLENSSEIESRIDRIIFNLQRYSSQIGGELYEMPEECKKFLIRALQFMDWFELLFPHQPIFLYGGALRDILWKKTPADLDFVTSVALERLQSTLNVNQKLCSVIQLPKSTAGQVSFCTLLLPESSEVKYLFQVRCDLKILINPEKGIIPLLELDRLTWLDFNVNAIYMNRLGILDAPPCIIRDILLKSNFIIMPIIKNHLTNSRLSLDKIYPGYNSVEIFCLLTLAEDPSRVFRLIKFFYNLSLLTISLQNILFNINALSLVFYPKHFYYDLYSRRDYLVETLNRSIMKFVCELNRQYKFDKKLGLEAIRKNKQEIFRKLFHNLSENFIFLFNLGIPDVIFRSKFLTTINRKPFIDKWYANFLIDTIADLQLQFLMGRCFKLLPMQMKLMLTVMIIDAHVERKVLRESIEEYQEQIRVFIDQEGWGKSYAQWNKKISGINFFDFDKMIQLGLKQQQNVLQEELQKNFQIGASLSKALPRRSKGPHHFNLELSLWKKLPIEAAQLSATRVDYDAKYASIP